MEVSENLQNQLAELIQNVASAATSAKSFLIQEVPIAVQEVLYWYATYSFIQFAASLTLGGLLVWANYRIFQYLKEPIPKKWGKNEMEARVHSDLGCVVTLVTILVSMVMFGITASMFSLQWLKIWIAPRLFLIEFAANLAKDLPK